MRAIAFALLTSASTIALAACGDDDHTHDHDHDAGVTDTGVDDTSTSDTAVDGSAEQSVEIRFDAVLGGAPAACGTPATGVGEPMTTLDLTDLRWFVSDVRLISGDGTEVPLTLTADGLWQLENLAMIDLEDASGGCANGTAPTNDRVIGTAPATDIAGIAFTVGVPFELNHIDAATAPSPLSGTSMHWSWQGGYKFIRLEATTEAGFGYRLHLGSTACQGEIGAITGCDNPNRVEVRLDGFDPATDVVRLDLDAYFAGMNIDFNTEGSAPGCMSAPDDPECILPFERLGLAGDAAQSVFVTAARAE